MWQILEKEMIFNAKALEYNEALEVSRKFAKQNEDKNTAALDKFKQVKDSDFTGVDVVQENQPEILNRIMFRDGDLNVYQNLIKKAEITRQVEQKELAVTRRNQHLISNVTLPLADRLMGTLKICNSALNLKNVKDTTDKHKLVNRIKVLLSKSGKRQTHF